jgi:hypothetical protein
MEEIKISGVSQFFFYAIPAVLALAALWWLAFAEGAHSFRRLLSQEKRHAEIVGAAKLPKAPMKITVKNSRDESLEIDRAEIDGKDLWIYYKNVGPGSVRAIQLEWRLIAPDGTVLKAEKGHVSIYSENDAPDALDAGERGEAKYKLPSDPRAVSLDLRLSHY